LINLGPGDFVLIGLALLLVFGAGRLPAIGDFIGRTLRGKGEPPKP
jgi:Sec-independent protein translocase protein TatA